MHFPRIQGWDLGDRAVTTWPAIFKAASGSCGDCKAATLLFFRDHLIVQCGNDEQTQPAVAPVLPEQLDRVATDLDGPGSG